MTSDDGELRGGTGGKGRRNGAFLTDAGTVSGGIEDCGIYSTGTKPWGVHRYRVPGVSGCEGAAG
jgi:hypothetical protein